MTITFCGHSDFIPNDDCEQKILSILEQTVGDSPAELLLGGYGNFDAFALACGKKYKSIHKGVRLVFVTPYLKNDSYTREYSSSYDLTVYPPIENVPPKYAISHRNKYMVECADIVIAFVKYSFGGAYKTYKHAISKGKTVFNLAYT